MTPDDRFLGALLEIKGDVGSTKRGVEDLSRDIKEVKTRLDQKVTKDECSSRYSKVKRALSEVNREVTGVFKTARRDWWDKTGKKLAVISGILLLLGTVGGGFLWLTSTYSEFKKIVKKNGDSNPAINHEQKKVNQLIIKTLQDIKHANGNGQTVDPNQHCYPATRKPKRSTRR